ncbi:hypothetical protein IW147_004187 [Coemansia sp. RSA 720]|nr:hypothetical protein IW147_004187 [Coemansia sp. RSA 720]
MLRNSLIICVLTLTQFVVGGLSGSGTITYHDYQSLPLEALKYNPPACGMPYAELDMTRITAVQLIDTTSECGQCIKVCNANDLSKFVYVLAVDKGGRGLDLSKPSFGKLFNIDDGVGPAQWSVVDNSHCVGIWSNGGQGGYDGSQVPAPAPDPAPAPAPAPVPVVSSSYPPATTPAPVTTPVSVTPEAPASVPPTVVQPAPSTHVQVPVTPPVVQRSTTIPSTSELAPTMPELPKTSNPVVVQPSSEQLPDSSSEPLSEDSVSNNEESEYSQAGIPHDALSSSIDNSSGKSSSLSDDEDLDDAESSNAMRVSLAVSVLLFTVILV